MSRIARGFHRLAIVVASPIALAAVMMAGFAYQERRVDVSAFEQATAKRQANAAKKVFEFKDEKGGVFEVEAVDQAAAAAGFERFKKMAPTAPPPPAGFVIESEPGPWAKYPRARSNPFEDLVPKPPKSFLDYFGISALTLAASVLAYVAIRSVGWIIAGFMRDPHEAG